MTKKRRNKKAKTETQQAAAPVYAPLDLPVWLVWATYGVLTLFLFRAFVFSGEMLFGSDTEAAGYMLRAFYAESLKTGTFPRWNPLLFGGTPFLEALSGGDSLYPPSVLLLLVMPTFRALGWKLVGHVFVAGLGMYGWTRCLGVSRPAAFIAGLGYLVAPYMVTLVFPGHDGKLFVTALTPFLFWGVERFLVSGSRKAWAAIGCVVALVTLTTHFQMAYFLFGAAGMYALYRALQIYRLEPEAGGSSRGRSKRGTVRFALFLAASVLGAGVAGVQLLPAVDYIRADSRRSATTTEATADVNKLYAAQFSMHAEEAMASLMIPEFVGNSQADADWARGTYWGKNPFKLNHEYIGWALLILAGLSFFGQERRDVRLFMAGLFTVAFLYTLGAASPIWNLLYHTLPGIKLFRSASMVIFLAGFAVTTLAAFGAQQLLDWTRHDAPSHDAASRYIWGMAGLSLVVLVSASSGGLFSAWTEVLYDGIGPDKLAARATLEPYIVRGALVSLVTASIIGGLAWAARTGRVQPVGVTLVLALLISIDGARIDDPFLVTRDFNDFNYAGPNVEFLLARQRTESPFRVFDFNRQGQEVRAAMFGLEIVTGHHPNDMARYRELIGMEGGGQPEHLLGSTNILRILNVRYVIWPVRQAGALEGLQPISTTRLADGSIYEAVYQLDDLPRARLVAEAVVTPQAASVSTLLDPTFDVETAVVIEDPAPLSLGGGVPDGNVDWVTRSANEMRLSVETDRNSLLVISQNYYPAWQASVDEIAVTPIRVNHALIAIPLEAGTHEVVLTYRSETVWFSLWVSAFSTLLLLLGVALGPFGGTEGRRKSAGVPQTVP